MPLSTTTTDFDPFLRLPDGGCFPSLGLGTWKIPDGLASGIVREAVGMGYRHFDCACDYGNEPAVGRGLREALRDGFCRRDDLWITSKLWNTYHEPRRVRAACERSLRDLGLDELDLYLVHFPVALAYVPFEERYPPGWIFDPGATVPRMEPIPVPYAETWGAMEALQRAGLVKRIGVCNLNVSLLRELLSTGEVRPAVNQVEMHPYLAQERLLRFCRDEAIAVTAFSPFGAGSYVPLGMAASVDSVLLDPVVTGIAAARGCSAARVVLRWAVQRGTAVIPKSQTSGHLRENRDVFSFALDESEMAALTGLDRHRRYNDPGVFCESAFGTFYPVFD